MFIIAVDKEQTFVYYKSANKSSFKVEEERIMKNRKKTYRIKSKFRFTTSITVALIVLVFMTNMVLGLDDASSLTKSEPIEVQIEVGDSLWNIACEYGPNRTDIRKVVYDICNLNDITAGSIQPGQTILMPDYCK